MAVSSTYVKNCPRCFLPINKGDKVASYVVVDGVTRWAHAFCQERVKVRSESAEPIAQAICTGVNGFTSALTAPLHEKTSDERIRQVATEAVAELLASAASKSVEDARRAYDEALASVRSAASSEVAKIVSKRLPVEIVHVFKQPNREDVRLSGEVFHPKFDRIIRLACAGKPIFLPGPTGCGKTYAAMQLAKVLGRSFGMIACSPGMTESQILGRSIPRISHGDEVYRSSEFIRLYEGGGVFLFDELDAADPSILLVINAALANAVVPVPNRPEQPLAKRHAEFVCVAAANTWGTGGSREYCGRNPLDEATLDRFRVGTVPCDYSDEIERAVCPDKTLYKVLKEWRRKMIAAGIKRVLSTRFFKDCYDMLEAGDGYDEIELAFFGGWRKEEVAKVLDHELNRGDS